MTAPISLIVAADEGELIGRGGGLPWHFSEDLKRFKALTVGHVVITGRRNQDDMVARLGRPLPGRTTIVVTRRPDTADTDEVVHVGSVEAALAAARARTGDEIFVIGGAEIYEQALRYVHTVYLTRVAGRHDGDTYLRKDWLAGFSLRERDDHGAFAYERWTRDNYYFDHARTDEQLLEMYALHDDGVCLFCPGMLGRDGAQSILFRSAQWTVVRNKYPYRGTRVHVLLIPDAHVTDLADLDPPAQADFWVALRWVREHFQLEHYGLAARNGQAELTGSTIRHVHVHMLQGDVDDPGHEPVRVRLSSARLRVDPDQFDAGGA